LRQGVPPAPIGHVAFMMTKIGRHIKV